MDYEVENNLQNTIKSINETSDEATINKAKEDVITLLYQGPDFSIVDDNGYTPMMNAATTPKRTELLKLLLEKSLTPPTPDEEPFISAALKVAQENNNQPGIEILNAKLQG